MKHEAYQFEFPLRQGEFAFFDAPESFGVCGVLGAFSWWVVLRVHSFEVLPVVPFNALALLGLDTAEWVATLELRDVLRCYEVEIAGFGLSQSERSCWLVAVAEAYNFPDFEGWSAGVVLRLLSKVRRFNGVEF